MAKVSFACAPDVERVARELIKKHHQRLIEADIVYLFRLGGKWLSHKKTRWGQAEKANPKIKHFTEGADFIITINYEVWFRVTESVREAMVDHELCHCGRGDDDKEGNPTWFIDSHTVEDFAPVVRRRGLWTEDLKAVLKAFEDSKVKQTELFNEPVEEGVVENGQEDLDDSAEEEGIEPDYPEEPGADQVAVAGEEITEPAGQPLF